MSDNTSHISDAFRAFMHEAPEHAKAWGEMIAALAKASDLDPKTRDLAYIAVLAALNRVSGIPFHAASARSNGASRQEVISAVLVGLPAAGHIVTRSLPAAISAFDSEQ